MDEELKNHLNAMEGRLRAGAEAMEGRASTEASKRLDDAFTRFSQHILHEMDIRFAEVNTRLESMDSRCSRRIRNSAG